MAYSLVEVGRYLAAVPVENEEVRVGISVQIDLGKLRSYKTARKGVDDLLAVAVQKGEARSGVEHLCMTTVTQG